MPKIRDLGINVIPVNMRPLEGAIPLNVACRGETCVGGTSGQCVPSCKAPSVQCAAASPKKYEATGFSAPVIAQLRQQLHHQLGT